MDETQISELQSDIRTFFNLIPVHSIKTPPEYLFRISSNDSILGREVNFLTKVSQLLAPPIELCNYNRCNIPGERVLYTATDELTAYWETKPKKGDTITISIYKAKEKQTLNIGRIGIAKSNIDISHTSMQNLFSLLDDFFIEVFTLPVERRNPIEYLFSSIIASELLFVERAGKPILDAIEYPSVQREMHGYNFAIKNDLIFEKYNLIEANTRWILEEIENVDPKSNARIIDDLISSVSIKEFNFEEDKILYGENIASKFLFFKYLQNLPGKQARFKNQDEANIHFRETIEKMKNKPPVKKDKYSRNQKVTVLYYNNGPLLKDVKYKKIEADLLANKCFIIGSQKD
jgi:hypothetical protein